MDVPLKKVAIVGGGQSLERFLRARAVVRDDLGRGLGRVGGEEGNRAEEGEETHGDAFISYPWGRGWRAVLRG